MNVVYRKQFITTVSQICSEPKIIMKPPVCTVTGNRDNTLTEIKTIPMITLFNPKDPYQIIKSITLPNFT